MGGPGDHRLPTTVLPSAYRLRIDVALEPARLGVTVHVDVRLAAPMASVELNALELEIDDAAARLPDGERVPATVTLDADRERATLRFDHSLPEGGGTLEMRFPGPLSEQLVGLSRSTFVAPAGVERSIAATFLCPTDARRVFPCFD